ncbi:RNA-directed DNA polymerase [Idiomarina sp.]|uniref:RNA-directed DNA polymerase n=1 Tax=Idiomarina sp. TaxID=1874361 RepID=UPI003A8D03A0
MKLLREKYWKLTPSMELLSDKLVLTQAWKKSHAYIRARNWYADTLALDVSALTIEESVEKWSRDLGPGLNTHKVELILAGKSESWGFDGDEGWQPTGLIKRAHESSSNSKIKAREDRPPLRPLSHLSVRDQTYATAVMLCAADFVESRQGECTENPFVDRQNQVYSYGNRLLCDWRTPHDAWFRWGNSETYRKFFVDYQSFLSRSSIIGQHVQKSASGGREVYVVSLDLESFFNSIDLEHLNNLLQEVSCGEAQGIDSDFWSTTKRILTWKWNDKEVRKAESLGLKNVTKGLPQGLVAAGFFANVYMLNFDEAISSKLNQSVGKEKSIWLHDYCRYVDDLRLVISSDISDTEQLKDIIDDFVSRLLKNTCNATLKINKDKTKINSVTDLANASSISNRLKAVQQDLSGPNDRESLETTLGILENFLTTPTVKSEKSHVLSDEHEQRLLSLTQYDHDVRADTLKRFAANRLESVVRKKRRISSSSDSDTNAQLLSEAENELLAKKLIHAWTTDPSLALLLRKAMEIYPDAELFEPILQVIFQRSSFGKNPLMRARKNKNESINQYVMDFLLADMFRCGVDFVYYFDKMDFPSSLEPKSLLELLARFAVKTVNSRLRNVSFVNRQALMLLASVNRPTLASNIKRNIGTRESSVEGLQELTLQKELLRILSGLDIKYHRQTSVLFEIASQITGHYDSYSRRFLETATSHENEGSFHIKLLPFAKRGGLFWDNIWADLEKNRNDYGEALENLKWARPCGSQILLGKKQSLFNLITSESHAFEYEQSLIKLAKALFERFCDEDDFNPPPLSDIIVALDDNSNNWNTLYRPSSDLYIEQSRKKLKRSVDPRYAIPEWIDDTTEKRLVYWIGMVLRAAALGSPDYTGNLWNNSKIAAYRGVKATWFKRRMAMMHSPESIIGEDATISDWFSEFLMKCLQWPGFEVNKIQHSDIASANNISDVISVIKNRIKKLDSLYCEISDTPGLPTRIGPNLDLKNFRIVTVQPLLPKPEWFINDMKLDRSEVKPLHREHIASVCSLVLKTLEAKSLATGTKDERFANIIVFPETSVHIDDQDLIRSLADKTKSIIFAGMVFTEKDSKLVNFARWFIPNYRGTERTWMLRDQGKQNLIPFEVSNGVNPYRPCQHFLEMFDQNNESRLITGAICYDATDIKLSADLRDKSDLFIISAYNQDVATFDNMAKALHWHMYQHVVIANTGIYGGSTIQAPYKQSYDKIIAHVHGAGQIAINMADIDLGAFTRSYTKYKEIKSQPAGFERDQRQSSFSLKKR